LAVTGVGGVGVVVVVVGVEGDDPPCLRGGEAGGDAAQWDGSLERLWVDDWGSVGG